VDFHFFLLTPVAIGEGAVLILIPLFPPKVTSVAGITRAAAWGMVIGMRGRASSLGTPDGVLPIGHKLPQCNYSPTVSPLISYLEGPGAGIINRTMHCPMSVAQRLIGGVEVAWWRWREGRSHNFGMSGREDKGGCDKGLLNDIAAVRVM